MIFWSFDSIFVCSVLTSWSFLEFESNETFSLSNSSFVFKDSLVFNSNWCFNSISSFWSFSSFSLSWFIICIKEFFSWYIGCIFKALFAKSNLIKSSLLFSFSRLIFSNSWTYLVLSASNFCKFSSQLITFFSSFPLVSSSSFWAFELFKIKVFSVTASFDNSSIFPNKFSSNLISSFFLV